MLREAVSDAERAADEAHAAAESTREAALAEAHRLQLELLARERAAAAAAAAVAAAAAAMPPSPGGAAASPQACGAREEEEKESALGPWALRESAHQQHRGGAIAVVLAACFLVCLLLLPSAWHARGVDRRVEIAAAGAPIAATIDVRPSGELLGKDVTSSTWNTSPSLVLPHLQAQGGEQQHAESCTCPAPSPTPPIAAPVELEPLAATTAAQLPRTGVAQRRGDASVSAAAAEHAAAAARVAHGLRHRAGVTSARGGGGPPPVGGATPRSRGAPAAGAPSMGGIGRGRDTADGRGDLVASRFAGLTQARSGHRGGGGGPLGGEGEVGGVWGGSGQEEGNEVPIRPRGKQHKPRTGLPHQPLGSGGAGHEL